MPQSMSQASLPVFEINLNALSAILDKAEAFATAKKFDAAVLLQCAAVAGHVQSHPPGAGRD